MTTQAVKPCFLACSITCNRAGAHPACGGGDRGGL